MFTRLAMVEGTELVDVEHEIKLFGRELIRQEVAELKKHRVLRLGEKRLETIRLKQRFLLGRTSTLCLHSSTQRMISYLVLHNGAVLFDSNLGVETRLLLRIADPQANDMIDNRKENKGKRCRPESDYKDCENLHSKLRRTSA